MASIKINNLQPAGSDLFNDSENYLNELNDQELDFINGGKMVSICSCTITFTITIITRM